MAEQTAAAGGTPTASVSMTHSMDITANDENKDPDELELEQARAELAGEDGTLTERDDLETVAAEQQVPGELPQEQATTQTTEDPLGREGKPQAAPAQPKKPGPIPYERFQEVNERARLLEQQLAYERGVHAAQQAQGTQQQPGQEQQPGQQPPAAQLTPDQAIAAARQRAIEAASQWERGEISAAEFETARGQSEDQIWQVRQAQIRPVQTDDPEPSLADEQILEQHRQELEAAHPVLQVMTADDITRLTGIAYAQAAAEGRPIGVGVRATARLREIVADLSEFYGPRWHPDAAPAPQPKTPAPAAGKPQLSQTAQARLRARGVAAQHPPVDTTRVGTTGNVTELSDSQISKMSDEEIMALPASVRARFL